MKDFHKKFPSLGNVVSQINDNKTLKNKVLINAGDLYNDLYYIYKDKYNKIVQIQKIEQSLTTKN